MHIVFCGLITVYSITGFLQFIFKIYDSIFPKTLQLSHLKGNKDGKMTIPLMPLLGVGDKHKIGEMRPWIPVLFESELRIEVT